MTPQQEIASLKAENEQFKKIRDAAKEHGMGWDEETQLFRFRPCEALRASIIQLEGTLKVVSNGKLMRVVHTATYAICTYDGCNVEVLLTSSSPIESVKCGHPGTCEWWEEQGLPAVKKAGEALSTLINGADLYQRQYIAGEKPGLIDWDASLRRDIDEAKEALEALKKEGLI